MQMRRKKPSKLLMVETKNVIEIHEKIIRDTGGNSGIISISNIDFSVDQANSSKDIFTQVARILFGLITNHGFVDGNKRTAAVATKSLLREHNLKLVAEQDDIWNVVHKIAEAKVKLPEVIDWIRKNVDKI